jgi:hypothetical protein
LLAPLLPAGEPVEQLLRKAQFFVPGGAPSADFREVHRKGGRILMGATAISVLAGAGEVALPKTIPVIAATAGFTEGFSFGLWAFGTWWIPLLLILGLWRHVHRHVAPHLRARPVEHRLSARHV